MNVLVRLHQLVVVGWMIKQDFANGTQLKQLNNGMIVRKTSLCHRVTQRLSALKRWKLVSVLLMLNIIINTHSFVTGKTAWT